MSDCLLRNRVDEKNFQEILRNVKTPIILQILSSQSMIR
jgi:hypothetical protein